ncbi:MarR family winged helix-turn-helix transcriptional regulator [Streptomyces griseus]|uniref:MarR-family transcriptional regulator n=1 Tax=Streptomyces griseus subsp. griseus (strain JCM 4626 / CBS 651.72 / NBRC 13350 / KCC S-0626 / ISP 5235) TaxID=455632 RepID=B1VPJ7_STRGG|nr:MULTISPECIES: MarR family transcriptional regulator [Streptomyces]MYR10768.1 MarR family transcriptional regulator [Streptomyces sp. SID724]MYR54566.1 MarR family transcriptional regulator [Streptomyces sp. SID4928]MYT82118.1 MarR family transcriptional regulator [Streptomyces sp. SID8364]EGE46564.1 transcriptional regulator, MarR family [Streptomyces sp. ACT-1]MBW3709522.1 MarR family transcriptional regulator [Streptomyces griseus]
MTTAPGTTPDLSGVPDAELLRLDHQVCFSLHAASRAFGGFYRQALKGLGLTYSQYLVMLVLWEHGPQPVKGIGDRLQLDSGTLSPLLKRLEAAGLVSRERSREDERSVLIDLTDEGARLRERALSVPRGVLDATGLSLDEVLGLQDVLGRLTAALGEAADAT